MERDLPPPGSYNVFNTDARHSEICFIHTVTAPGTGIENRWYPAGFLPGMIRFRMNPRSIFEKKIAYLWIRA